jgi:hypothetical protein
MTKSVASASTNKVPEKKTFDLNQAFQEMNIAQLLNPREVQKIGVSSTVHRIFHKTEISVSMVELLSLLKIKHSALQICETNHHYVNTTSERFSELQKWLNHCLDDSTSNKTLDMGIECILFQKKAEGSNDFTIPFVDATGTK